MNIPGIHQIQIPLPNNPLKILNSYWIEGTDRSTQKGSSLLIDTGFNHPEALLAVETALETLNVDREHMDLLATHLHSDHSGQLSLLRRDNSICYASTIDGKLINHMTQESYWTKFQGLYTLLGLDGDHIGYKEHPGYKYCPKTPLDFKFLTDGDLLAYGRFEFKVVEVPGHTPGQIVLFEENEGILISADHILDQITPNISFWGYEHGDSLGAYFASLDKVRKLNAKIALPSHRNIIENVNGRIDQLVAHHEERLSEVLDIIKKSKTALCSRAVAKDMHWEVRVKDFEAFPSPQKWFASAEAMAHLVHLETRGLLSSENVDGVVYFGLRA